MTMTFPEILHAPWSVKESADGWVVVNALGEGIFCGEEAEARIVAAAPELYVCLLRAGLEKCARCLCRCQSTCCTNEWRRAVAKAEGREKELREWE